MLTETDRKLKAKGMCQSKWIVWLKEFFCMIRNVSLCICGTACIWLEVLRWLISIISSKWQSNQKLRAIYLYAKKWIIHNFNRIDMQSRVESNRHCRYSFHCHNTIFTRQSQHKIRMNYQIKRPNKHSRADIVRWSCMHVALLKYNPSNLLHWSSFNINYYSANYSILIVLQFQFHRWFPFK